MATGNQKVIISVPTPLPMTTLYINATERAVEFKNFAEDSIALRTEHSSYIGLYVNWLIRLCEANPYMDKVITVHPRGNSSPTNRKGVAHNAEIALGRAKSLGAAIKKRFETDKKKSAIASQYTLAIDAQGLSDRFAREKNEKILRQLNAGNPAYVYQEPKYNTLPKAFVDNVFAGYRSAFVSYIGGHDVIEEDKEVFCRQLMAVKFAKQQSPAIDEIDAWIEDIKNSSRVSALFISAIEVQLKVMVPILKWLAKGQFFKALGISTPMGFLFTKGFEFLVPTDIAERFQFTNSTNRIVSYDYTGNKHHVDLLPTAATFKLIGFLRWCVRLPTELQKLQDYVNSQLREKLKDYPEVADQLIKATEEGRALAALAQQPHQSIFAKGSFLRLILGDRIVDEIRDAPDELMTTLYLEQDTTLWAKVVFREADAVYDLDSFSGVASAAWGGIFSSRPTVYLKFSADHGLSELGYRANVELTRFMAAGIFNMSVETSVGILKPAAG
jgi:hypothetical protein